MDLDPLSMYCYAPHGGYRNLPTSYGYVNQNFKETTQLPYSLSQNYNLLPNIQVQNENNLKCGNVEEKLDKPVIKDDDKVENLAETKPLAGAQTQNPKQVKVKRSNYWSVKITDKDFAFYGCAVCNISFTTLCLLDQHVTVHKDRITSYDLRVQNQLKRKRLKKEKKLRKVKKEKEDIELEIKPEEGFIGTEKVSDYSGGLVNDREVEDSIIEVESNDRLKKKCSTREEKEDIHENKKDRDEEKSSRSKKKIGRNKEVSKEEDGKNKDLQKIYKCFACQKQFSLSYYLRLHVRSHTDEKPYTCSICGQSFITASKLGRHNKRIHLAIRHQCRICFKFFSQFDLLTRHFDKKHPEDKLEGEPYDYNAILPYLKELEEELREKAESEKKSKEEETSTDQPQDEQPKEIIERNMQDEDQSIQPNEPPASIEKVIVPDLIDIEICEPVDEIKQEPIDDDFVGDDRDDFNFKDERCSDEDYFPTNTWATVSPPLVDPASPSPRRTRRPKVEGPITCDVCQKTIRSLTYLKIHMRTHTGEKPFKCYICNRGFITSSKMHRHVLTHTDSWGESEIKHEELINDEENNATVCEELKGKKHKTSKSKFHKKRQKKDGEKQKKRHQKRPHACEFCQKRFLHLKTLQVHKMSHEGEVLVLKCNYCLKEMVDEVSQKEHEETHTGPKPYVCTVCGKCYKKRETLMYHRKHHKPEKMEYVCDICSKRFNSPGKLQRHIVSHNVDKFVLRYECPVCAHMFNTKYHIQMHLNTHKKEGLILEENRNEILAMVLQNARKFPKHSGASANLSDIFPSDERSRICNICGEIFQHFYYLEEHLKSHGSKIALEDLDKPEVKKYTCQVCKKSFKLHYYLKLHSYTHTKEKPFTCQQCGKGFITKGKLKRHLESHMGLKKYQCHVCYKFFTRPSYLRIHVRTIHGTQDYNFRLSKGFGLGSLGVLSVNHINQDGGPVC